MNVGVGRTRTRRRGRRIEEVFQEARIRHLNWDQTNERFFRMSRILMAYYDRNVTWHLPYVEKWNEDGNQGG